MAYNSFQRVNYQSTSNYYRMDKWLKELMEKPLIACDFEVSPKWSQMELEHEKELLATYDTTDWYKRTESLQKLNAEGLSNPYLTIPTHLSIAWSNQDAYVFILTNEQVRTDICYWLVNFPNTQIWHNAGYDFSYIMHYTNELPKYFEDTQLLAKSLLNHVEHVKCITKLKKLEGHRYGDWAISKDEFKLEEQFNTTMLQYAATDACAAFDLYLNIIHDLEQTGQQNESNRSIACM